MHEAASRAQISKSKFNRATEQARLMSLTALSTIDVALRICPDDLLLSQNPKVTSVKVPIAEGSNSRIQKYMYRVSPVSSGFIDETEFEVRNNINPEPVKFTNGYTQKDVDFLLEQTKPAKPSKTVIRKKINYPTDEAALYVKDLSNIADIDDL